MFPIPTADLLELGGLFFVAALTPNLNFFIPIRPTLLTIVLAQHLPWLLVGIVASAGGVIGVLPLYGIAYKATDAKAVQRWLRYRPIRVILEKLKHHIFLLIVLLVVTPLPDQLIGIAAGAERYGVWKFVAANTIGRLVIYVPLAYLASQHAAEIQDVWTWLVHVLTI